MREESSLRLVFENVSATSFRFELEHSADLQTGTWASVADATIEPLEDDRFEALVPSSAASEGFFRVLGFALDSAPVKVVLNEVMTRNDSALADSEGDFPDWVDCIDFSNVSMKTECIDPSTSIGGVSDDLMIPNPIYDNYIVLPTSVDEWQILNTTGQTILMGSDIYIQLTALSTGLYQLITQKEGQVSSKAILIP